MDGILRVRFASTEGGVLCGRDLEGELQEKEEEKKR